VGASSGPPRNIVTNSLRSSNGAAIDGSPLCMSITSEIAPSARDGS